MTSCRNRPAHSVPSYCLHSPPSPKEKKNAAGTSRCQRRKGRPASLPSSISRSPHPPANRFNISQTHLMAGCSDTAGGLDHQPITRHRGYVRHGSVTTPAFRKKKIGFTMAHVANGPPLLIMTARADALSPPHPSYTRTAIGPEPCERKPLSPETAQLALTQTRYTLSSTSPTQ